MKRMVRSLNMFILDYLIVPVWAVFSVLGNRNAARIMIPITIVFLALNYLNTKSTTRLFMLDINLAAASLAGIVLNSFLFIRFVYADPQVITDMVSIIFFYTFFVIAACILCLTLKLILHKRNMRIISRMAEGAYDADDADEDEYYNEDDDDEDEYEDEDEDEDEEGSEDGKGFLTSVTNLLKKREEDDTEEEEDEDEDEDDDEDDDDDGYEKPDGPKFRVVKK